MGWETKYLIPEVLGNNRLNARQIHGRLNLIGEDVLLGTVNSRLRKMTFVKQLNRERVGQCYFYWNSRAREVMTQ
jgi:hypothetical protein